MKLWVLNRGVFSLPQRQPSPKTRGVNCRVFLTTTGRFRRRGKHFNGIVYVMRTSISPAQRFEGHPLTFNCVPSCELSHYDPASPHIRGVAIRNCSHPVFLQRRLPIPTSSPLPRYRKGTFILTGGYLPHTSRYTFPAPTNYTPSPVPVESTCHGAGSSLLLSPVPRANRINPLVNVSTRCGQLARGLWYCRYTSYRVLYFHMDRFRAVRTVHARKVSGLPKGVEPGPPAPFISLGCPQTGLRCGSWQQKSLESRPGA